MARFVRLPGVPSTLNKIVKSPDGAAILQPYPSSSASLPPLIYVQSIEVDPTGLMWILEVGRVRYDDGSGVITSGVPSLILWDIMHEVLIDRYDFPDNVSQNCSFTDAHHSCTYRGCHTLSLFHLLNSIYVT